MAKVIVYKCDFCEFTDDSTLSGGMKEPRKLWMIGYMEACDNCLKKAQAYLLHVKDHKDA